MISGSGDSVQKAVERSRDVQQAVTSRISGLEQAVREGKLREERIGKENLELLRSTEEQAERIRHLERDIAESERRLNRMTTELSTAHHKLSEANEAATLAMTEATTANEISASLRETIGDLNHRVEDLTAERDLAVGQLNSFTSAFDNPFFDGGEVGEADRASQPIQDPIDAEESRISKDIRSTFGSDGEGRRGRAA